MNVFRVTMGVVCVVSIGQLMTAILLKRRLEELRAKSMSNRGSVFVSSLAAVAVGLAAVYVTYGWPVMVGMPSLMVLWGWLGGLPAIVVGYIAGSIAFHLVAALLEGRSALSGLQRSVRLSRRESPSAGVNAASFIAVVVALAALIYAAVAIISAL